MKNVTPYIPKNLLETELFAHIEDVMNNMILAGFRIEDQVWSADRELKLNEYTYPSLDTPFRFRVTKAGTSGTTEPVFLPEGEFVWQSWNDVTETNPPTVVDAVHVGGSATWEAESVALYIEQTDNRYTKKFRYAELDYDAQVQLAKELGYDYLALYEGTSEAEAYLKNITPYINLFEMFKGNRYGLELILNLNSVEFQIKEWWEEINKTQGLVDTADTVRGVGGSGCTIDTTDTAGVVTVAVVNAGGTGYVIDDEIEISGGNGDAVLKVLTLSGSAVATVSIENGGTGYTGGTGVATVFGNVYKCIRNHTSDTDTKPTSGGSWQSFWTRTIYDIDASDWTDATEYKATSPLPDLSPNEFLLILYEYTDDGAIFIENLKKFVASYIHASMIVWYNNYGFGYNFGYDFGKGNTA